MLVPIFQMSQCYVEIESILNPSISNFELEHVGLGSAEFELDSFLPCALHLRTILIQSSTAHDKEPENEML